MGKQVFVTMKVENDAEVETQIDRDTSLQEILKLSKHIFLGVVLFMALGIPAIALDLLTQGMALLKIDVTLATPPAELLLSKGIGQGPIGIQARTVAVSAPVRYALTGFELLLLTVDVLSVGCYIISTLVRYVRSLKWH